MKRIYTVIFVLITLSLIGIIVIQLSWINNMTQLREEQIKQKVDIATRMVAEEFSNYKGAYSSMNKLGPNAVLDNFSMDFFKPVTVAHRFSVADIDMKIKQAFKSVRLENIPFEFALASFNPRSNMPGQLERTSKNFEKVFEDTVHNYNRQRQRFDDQRPDDWKQGPDESLIVVVPDYRKFVYKSLFWDIATAILFTIIIITAFYLTVRTMLRQKKLGDIKNDFINNMTHEFKTPIATISLAVDALRNEKVMNDRGKMSYFNSIIKEENQRMNRQVETILKASQLEKQEVELVLKPLHVHEIIKDVADNFILQLEDKKGSIDLQLNAVEDLIEADDVHLSNLVNNMIDNAVKYAKDTIPPEIKISTYNEGKNFIFRIEDNGIGMTKETLKKIFERFYRAHTGNIHNVKGFGLGLSYVKTMVQAHNGVIKADSIPGRGSTFIIELPLKKVNG